MLKSDYIEDWETEMLYETFIYTDEGDGYTPPEREYDNQVLNTRLYCDGGPGSRCNKYVKGYEGYNGNFLAEDGTQIDLRNQMFICREHRAFRLIMRGK